MIVRCASIRCNQKLFADYAVLGDDIVLFNREVAEEYHNLISSLGLQISESKSIISYDMLEFAKRLMTRDWRDLSPIGPGLILSCIRRREMTGLLLATSIIQGYVKLSASFDQIKSVPGKFSSTALILWQCFGLRGLLSQAQIGALNIRGLDWFNSVISRPQRYGLFAALLSLYMDHIDEAVRHIHSFKVFRQFRRNKVKGNIARALGLALFFFSPSF